MPKRENTPQEPLRKPELTGAASATESSPPELGILVEALIEGARSRPDSAFEDHALAELAALPDDAYAAARERLAGAGVDLGRLDEAMLAYAVDAGAGPALSDSFGKALDPKLSEAERELVLAAETDPGAPFTEPHQGTLKLAWSNPPQKARLRAALKGVKGINIADVDRAYDPRKDGDGLQGQRPIFERSLSGRGRYSAGPGWGPACEDGGDVRRMSS